MVLNSNNFLDKEHKKKPEESALRKKTRDKTFGENNGKFVFKYSNLKLKSLSCSSF